MLVIHFKMFINYAKKTYEINLINHATHFLGRTRLMRLIFRLSGSKGLPIN